MLRNKMEQFSKLHNFTFDFVEDLAEVIIEIDQLEQKADSKAEFERLTFLLSLFEEDYGHLDGDTIEEFKDILRADKRIKW